jgi:tRNA pseudouridine38-40 synthase
VAEPVIPTPDGGLVRVRFDIAYDGTNFSGWAIQPGRRTIQGVVQQALAMILRAPATLTVAGRTDAGVHARGQVAHADIVSATWSVLAPSLLRRLAGVLPADVRVRHAVEVPADFDARFAALWRRYEYRLTDDPFGADPMRRFDTVAWPRPLDARAMAEAAAMMVGEHDFAAFCKRREGATTIRALQRFAVARAGGVIHFEVRADAFCHSMVRSLVGALLAVGEGRRPASWPSGLLKLAVRADGVAVAPARGLTLVEVGYPPDDALAARAAVTRNLRGQPA